MTSKEIDDKIKRTDYLFLATYWAQASKNWKKLVDEATNEYQKMERLKHLKDCRKQFLRCIRVREKFLTQLEQLGI